MLKRTFKLLQRVPEDAFHSHTKSPIPMASTPAQNLIHEPPSLPNTPDHKRTKVISPSPRASHIAGTYIFLSTIQPSQYILTTPRSRALQIARNGHGTKFPPSCCLTSNIRNPTTPPSPTPLTKRTSTNKRQRFRSGI